MEETRMLQQVMQYIEALIGGMDPVSWEDLSADSVLRREDLMQCYRYISKKIGRELGALAPESGAREDLYTVMKRFAGSMGIRGSMGSFLLSSAKVWLKQEGYLTGGQDETGAYDRAAGRITPKGKAAGFSESEPDGEGQTTILCDGRAKNLLRRSLDQIQAQERREWEPLSACLTEEWYGQIVCSQEPVTLTSFLKQINSLLPADLPRRIMIRRVNYWMLRNGYLEVCYNGTKRWYSPTWKGKMKGIVAEHKKLLWTTAAQQFLLDHLKIMVSDLASGDAYRIPAVPERFAHADEARARMEYDGKDQYLYDIEVRINRALASAENENYRLPHGVLLTWLRERGYYAMQDQNHYKKALAVTEEGRAAGFCMKDGYVTLSEAAQHLVLDELEDISAFYYHLAQSE